MRILLSNDDGCQAPGLRCLADLLRQNCDELTVVAPDRTLAFVRRILLLPGVRRVGARVADKAGDLHIPRRNSLRLLALYAVNTAIRLGAFLLVVAGLTGGTGVGARAVGAYALGQGLHAVRFSVVLSTVLIVLFRH